MSGQEPFPGTILCRFDELEDPGSKGFVFGEGASKRSLFVVRKGEAVFAYENVCPHIGVPLEMEPDEFLSDFTGEIMCHTHGALFRIEDGFCTQGPCRGESLKKIEVTLSNGEVLVV